MVSTRLKNIGSSSQIGMKIGEKNKQTYVYNVTSTAVHCVCSILRFNWRLCSYRMGWWMTGFLWLRIHLQQFDMEPEQNSSLQKRAWNKLIYASEIQHRTWKPPICKGKSSEPNLHYCVQNVNFPGWYKFSVGKANFQVLCLLVLGKVH